MQLKPNIPLEPLKLHQSSTPLHSLQVAPKPTPTLPLDPSETPDPSELSAAPLGAPSLPHDPSSS
jgi:hypothetical protein